MPWMLEALKRLRTADSEANFHNTLVLYLDEWRDPALLANQNRFTVDQIQSIVRAADYFDRTWSYGGT